MKLGDTFLVIPPTTKPHLWVLTATGAGVEIDSVLWPSFIMFNMTSIEEGKEGPDLSCLIQRGEHPFVKGLTAICYQLGLDFPVFLIKQEIDNRNFLPRDSVRAEILERIQRGALKSEHTKRAFKPLIRAALSPPKSPT